MKTYVGSVNTGLQGSDKEFEFEVDDNASEDEIEAAAREAMFECIEWGYYRTEISRVRGCLPFLERRNQPCPRRGNPDGF